MEIRIDKELKKPVYLQLADSIRDNILRGDLKKGSALPSERALSKMLQIHRNTVVKAYAELKDRELIDSRQGVGYVVTFGEAVKISASRGGNLRADGVPSVGGNSKVGVAPNEGDNSRAGIVPNAGGNSRANGILNASGLSNKGGASNGRNVSNTNTKSGHISNHPKHVNWLTAIKDEFIDREKAFDTVFQRYRNEGKITFSSGVSMPSVYKRTDISQDIANIISYEGKSQYFYSPYKGDKGLRQQISSFLSTKGISANSSQIQIVTETNQAIDFITNLLVRPADTVILSEPVSPDTYRALKLAGARIITVPVDKNGINVEAIENIVSEITPRAIFVDSSFQDPTTVRLSDDRRQKLIDISNKYRIPIVEEDAASELYYNRKPIVPIKTLDKMNNVIYIYSFSLTSVPGLSLAFIVADKEVIKSLSYIVNVRFVATDWLTQRLMADYLENGTYYRNISIFRENYKAKRDLLCDELNKMNARLLADGLEPVSFTKPEGGVYIWAKLPESIDCKAFDKECYRMGLVVIPGYIFYPFKNGGRNYVRLNYSYEKIENIPRGVKIMEEAIRKLG